MMIINLIINACSSILYSIFNMKASQCLQNARAAKFYEFKQLQYFKQIIRKTEDVHMKQILPMHVYKLTTKTLDHEKYAYIPEKTVDDCLSGALVDEQVTQFSKKTVVFRIDKKLDNILRHVLVLKIPIISQLRVQDRFSILYSSFLETYSFNKVIHRKGEEFRGIYFIIEGQVKIINQKLKDSCQFLPKGNFIGLDQLKNQLNLCGNTVISNFNNTKLLFISKETLFTFKLQQSESTINELFMEFHDQNNSHLINLENINKITKRKSDQEKRSNQAPLKLNNFIKKCDQFMMSTTKEDQGFNQFLKSKKILLQLRETMSAAKLNRKNRGKENIIISMQEQIKKQPKLNTNLASCRSRLLQSLILKRYSSTQNSQQIQLKTITEPIRLWNHKKDIDSQK